MGTNKLLYRVNISYPKFKLYLCISLIFFQLPNLLALPAFDI